MIILDGNYFGRRFFHMAHAQRNDPNMDWKEYYRHSFLLNINGIKYKFGKEYGELVLGVDSHSWRKDFYPDYKKKNLTEEDKELNKIFIFLYDELVSLLDSFSSIKVVKANGAEGDDILGVLSKTDGKHLMYSGDKDIVQLISDKCDYYDFNEKCIIKIDKERQRKNLIKHILIGDRADNIKNIMNMAETTKDFNNWFRRKYNFDITKEILFSRIVSNDNMFKNFEIESGLKAFKVGRFGEVSAEKFLEPEALKMLLDSNPIIKRNYEINEVLIDLSKIPQDVVDRVLENFNSQGKKVRNMGEIERYCDKHNLKYVKDRLKYFI